MNNPNWQILGVINELKTKPLQEINLGKNKIALSFVNGNFSASAISLLNFVSGSPPANS